jgi:hypothetical protein
MLLICCRSLAAAWTCPLQYVRTTGLCRVLVIPRSVYNSLAADYPMSARVVLDNLQARAEQVSPAQASCTLLQQPTAP